MDTVSHTDLSDTVSAGSVKGLWAQAADVRRRARAVLDGHSGRCSHRLTLVLASVVVLTVAVGLYAAVAGLYMAGSLLSDGWLWLDTACTALYAVLFLLLVLPLLTAVWRMACLMVAPDGEIDHGRLISVPLPTLTDICYPFTSFRAYGRTMLVALETVGWVALIVVVPVLCFRLSGLLLMQSAAVPTVWDSVWLAVRPVLCILLGAGMFVLSGRRAGFGYHMFVHADMTIGEVMRFYRGFARPCLPVLVWRISLAGWFALSVVGILVPFVMYTGPYGMCCAAVYGRFLKRR